MLQGLQTGWVTVYACHQLTDNPGAPMPQPPGLWEGRGGEGAPFQNMRPLDGLQGSSHPPERLRQCHHLITELGTELSHVLTHYMRSCCRAWDTHGTMSPPALASLRPWKPNDWLPGSRVLPGNCTRLSSLLRAFAQASTTQSGLFRFGFLRQGLM